MSRIYVETDRIISNFAHYKGDNIVCKSNLYGFGYELLWYIKKYIRKITVADIHEYRKCFKYLGDEVEYVILYTNFEKEIGTWIKSTCISFCINRLEQIDYIEEHLLPKFRFYIRIDEMLGLHGISLHEAKNIRDLSEYKGVIVHINEFISDTEKEIIREIELLTKQEHVLFSLGGSNVYSYLSNNEGIEYRYAANLFQSNTTSLFELELNVLNLVHLEGSSIQIGYKSDRKEIHKGTLLLVDIGYGNWPLLSRIYKNNIKIHFEEYRLEIPVYPCMNTTWLYCKDALSIHSTICLFGNMSEIETLCSELDIDKDELYTSFHDNVERVYR